MGIPIANWKVVRTFIQERFGRVLSRSSCFDYLHLLEFVVKRPKKRLVKAAWFRSPVNRRDAPLLLNERWSCQRTRADNLATFG